MSSALSLLSKKIYDEFFFSLKAFFRLFTRSFINTVHRQARTFDRSASVFPSIRGRYYRNASPEYSPFDWSDQHWSVVSVTDCLHRDIQDINAPRVRCSSVQWLKSLVEFNRERFWLTRQIESVQVSRIAFVCREPDTASRLQRSCLPTNSLEILTFAAIVFRFSSELQASRITNVIFFSSHQRLHVRLCKHSSTQ